MGAIIEATTEAKTSNPFLVLRGETVGVKCPGLAGAETAVIQTLSSNHVWSNVEATSGTMTATEAQTSIVASGTYRVVKSATVASCPVDID